MSEIIDQPGSRQFNVTMARTGQHRTVVADYMEPRNGWVIFKIGPEYAVNWVVLMLPDREVKLIEEEPLSGPNKLEYERWVSTQMTRIMERPN